MNIQEITNTAITDTTLPPEHKNLETIVPAFNDLIKKAYTSPNSPPCLQGLTYGAAQLPAEKAVGHILARILRVCHNLDVTDSPFAILSNPGQCERMCHLLALRNLFPQLLWPSVYHNKTVEEQIESIKTGLSRGIHKQITVNGESLCLSTLPIEIFAARGIEALMLRNNALTALPSQINELQDVKRLDLVQNRFNDFPTGLEQLPFLKDLWLCANQLTTIDPKINEYKALETLYLNTNAISQLPKLPNTLRILYLNHNRFEELTDLDQLTHLEELNIGANPLKTLPKLPQSLKTLIIDIEQEEKFKDQLHEIRAARPGLRIQIFNLHPRQISGDKEISVEREMLNAVIHIGKSAFSWLRSTLSKKPTPTA